MFESSLISLAAKVVEIAASPALQQISLAWGVKDDLRRLESTMSAIRAVLLDAEKQQVSNHLLRDWLGKLKYAFYDADVVLDEFQIEAWRREVESITGKVRKFFSGSNQLAFRFKMGQKIRKVRESFDEIARDMTQFNLTEGIVEMDVFLYRETHSFVDASDVIGRDHDRDNIVQLLMRNSDSDQLSIIPIVGLGGLGKTTLAKLVHNDKRIVDQFDLRIWVCVSEEFDLRKIIKKILKSASPGADCRNLDLDQLQSHLRYMLRNKKYFLVLDDVWNEDRSKWIKLRSLLKCGATGSKILVTTRIELVATFMATSSTSTYTLKGLSGEDCLSLFWKAAFRTSHDVEHHPDLAKIGCGIVRKCKGVPLAVITLGNLLYMKFDKQEWTNVRDNEIWKLEQKEEDILPALKLSYDKLPSHLKQCFAYCSLFPKDFEITCVQLIFMWNTQGLLGPLERGQSCLDLGEKYFEQLRSRGFFEHVIDTGPYSTFKMHDLVHDLAVLVGKPESFTIDSNDIQCNNPTKVHHLSFTDCSCLEGNEVPCWLLEMKHLRTIFFPYLGEVPPKKFFLETCISRFHYLRMMDLGGQSFEVLPSSINKLKHLRHLNLSKNVKLKSLPNSICKLVALEMLNLAFCKGLERLPKSIGKLIRLRFLFVTTKEKCLPEKEIRRLTSLQHFCIVQCPNMKFLLSNEGMRSLSSLRTLWINACKSLVSLPASGLKA
ncbi:hypothetical protein NMG60_11032003 [Bertholletia excelsa]